MMATMVTATVMAMMLPPLPTATMLMTTTAVIQGWQLDDGNSTTMMGQQPCTLMMTAMKVMAETATVLVTVTLMATAMATGMMPLPLPIVTMSMKTTATI
jgi:hypothetical protein